MTWQYSSSGAFSMAAAVLAALLAIVTWRRRPTPGAAIISCLLFLVTVWSAAYAFELWSADLPSKLLWNDIEYPAIVTIPWLWLAFVLRYTGREGWMTRRTIGLAAVVPVITVILVWTNSSLIYTHVGLDTVNGVAMLAADRGPWWWVAVCYAYVPLLVSAGMLVQSLTDARALYRGQATVLLLGALAPWAAQIAYAAGFSTRQHQEITPFAFIFMGAAAILGFFRFRLLDITPIPREAMLEAIGDGLIVTDTANRIVHINKAAQRIVGAPAGRVIGMPAADVLSNRLDLRDYSRDQREVWAEIVLDDKGGPHNYDLRVSPLVDAHGVTRGSMATLRDITARKVMEQALRQSEERYRGLVESQSELIVRVDPQGRFTFVNDAVCRTFGKTSEELLGRTFMQFVHEEDLPGTLAAMAGLADPPYRVGIEQRALAVDGWRWFSWENYSLRDAEGRMVEVQGVAKDITETKHAAEERQRLNAQLQHTQKLESLGVLAGGIAHDFNNLLMGVLGQADLLLSDLESGSPLREGVEQIELAAQRAADLTGQMLAYSGKGHFRVEPIDLSALVEEIAHLLTVSVSKNATLEYGFVRDLPALEGDPDQIRQVVMNLITNASDAIGETDGRISVTTGIVSADSDYLSLSYLDDELPPGKYVYVEIVDDGCGMDEQTRVRMFDPFFTTKFTGRGLGLAAVLGIVRGHRGAIFVDSEPGRGTSFRVLFPLSTLAIEKPVKPVEAGRAPVGSTILVVDDDDIVRSVTGRMLERGGYRVLMASDGLEGVQRMREHVEDISAVLLDTMMPRMNGREAFLEMRRIRPDIRVVVMSGYSELEVSRRFADTDPATGFIQKPFDSAGLLAKLAEAMSAVEASCAPASTIGDVLVESQE